MLLIGLNPAYTTALRTMPEFKSAAVDERRGDPNNVASERSGGVGVLMSDADLAVATYGLSRLFGTMNAMIDVDLRIERGSVVGLLGPNGSGKTTLIRMLSTLSRPTSGRALVGGFDVRTQKADVRRSIGLTGQFAAVDEFLTGCENVKMMGRLAGMSVRGAGGRADELLDSFGLLDVSQRVHAVQVLGRVATSAIAGMPDRFRSMPIHTWKVLVARNFSDVVREMTQGFIMPCSV